MFSIQTKQKLDLDSVKFNVTRWKQSSLDGILVLGSNGEFPMMTSDERLVLFVSFLFFSFLFFFFLFQIVFIQTEIS